MIHDNVSGYSRVLVPIDSAASAERIVSEAARVANVAGGTLLLLHVVDERFFVLPGSYPVAESVAAALHDDGAQALARASELARGRGLAFETRLVESNAEPVSDVILRHAREWQADALVMGTHGRRGFNRLLLGSDAERVLRAVSVPLMLVKVGEPDRAASAK